MCEGERIRGKEGYETQVPVRGREMRFGRDRKIRSSGAPWSKHVREERRNEGVVRLLVDVWWHLLPRAGDCAGGRKVVPEVTLCWQSPRIRFLFRRWPATGWRAWWNRLSFLGKCSSAACLGRPVQVCDRHVIEIESRRFDNSVRWMPMAAMASTVRSRTNPVLQERESDCCRYYFLLYVFDYYLPTYT